VKRILLGSAIVLALWLIQLKSALSASDSSQGIAMASSENTAPQMDAEVKTNAFHEVLQKMGAGQKIDPKLWDQLVAAQNDGLQTGPKVGEKVPDFTLPDENGKQWSLHELMGPKGLLLVFTRSADW
jgi:AhpC/TSA family